MRIAYLVAVIVIAGCTKENPNFCPDFPDDDCRNGNGRRCDVDNDCADEPGKPVCNAGDGPGVCVQCLVDSDCTGVDTPVCGDDNLCAGCRSDDDCTSSKACLETGACADKTNVIYAQPGADGPADCGAAPGANECSLKQAMDKVDATRNIIRLAPSTYDPRGELTITKPVTLIARGSTITRMGGGPQITVNNGQDFKLVGGTLKDGNSDVGILCSSGRSLEVHEAIIEDMDRSGIQGDACILIVSRSIIRRNLEGGINMVNTPTRVRITNNFIIGNGRNTTDAGGMLLRATNDSVVEFNTVVDNTAKPELGFAGGINCAAGTVNAPNNLVYRNTGGPLGEVEVVGTCMFEQSYTVHGLPGENAVGFKNPSGSTADYHLTATSPDGTIRNVSVCTTVDFDGDRRPVGDKCDLGADEFVP